MQENAVGWDPVTMYHPVSWVARLYILYLLYVFVSATVRLIDCARRIRSVKEIRGSVPAHIQFRLATLKRTTVIVILAACFVGLYGISNVLRAVAYEPRVSGGAIARGMSEALIPIEMGFFVALTMYAATAFLESRAEKRASD